MKIAVIGAGIVGVTTAYELALDGHEVTLMERRSTVAEESSFANAGIIAPGYVTPWAAPGMPGKVLRHLWGTYAPVKLGLNLSAKEMSWVWKWLGACAPEVYARSRKAMQALARMSQDRLHQITADLKLDYNHSQGCMILLRSESDSKLAQVGLKLLRDIGGAALEIDAASAYRIEPGLNQDTSLFGAIHLPNDEVANCRQFALLIKNAAQRLGVSCQFNFSVSHLDTANALAVHGTGTHPAQTFDAVVLCTGLDSSALMQPLGLDIPMAAVYGYSISCALRDPLNAPRSAVMDERFEVAISRLGNRVRVAGSAELGGHPEQHRTSAIRTLHKVLADWFPGAANLNHGLQQWKGARPMLPDGPPVIGASGIPGIWLNLGHGSSGWALACGSARMLADLVAGRSPQVDSSAFSLTRFMR